MKGRAQGHDRQRRHRLAGAQLAESRFLQANISQMTAGKLKIGVFAMEGINCLATTYFFYDIYFYTQARFNFHALQNLVLAAALGAVYAVAAYFGGQFAQKFGYFTSVPMGSRPDGHGISSWQPGQWNGGHHRSHRGGDTSPVPDLAGPGGVDERRRTAGSIAEFGWDLQCRLGSDGSIRLFHRRRYAAKVGIRKAFFTFRPFCSLLEMGLAFWLEREEQRQAARWNWIAPCFVPRRKAIHRPYLPPCFLKWPGWPIPWPIRPSTLWFRRLPALPDISNSAHAGRLCLVNRGSFVRAGAFVFLRLWPEVALPVPVFWPDPISR